MKKTYAAPAIEELDFKDTAVCGTGYRKVTNTSGGMLLTSSTECFSLRNWLFSWGGFDDEAVEVIEEED
ncbi:MAG: hypothetical protein K6G81_11095 [Lachnospiraceae bacterium]|nr:hypothetical protein [Lachnospiraceae bacterium]